MNETPPTYEHWDLCLPALVPRAALTPLTAQGFGTDASECLTSYLARLAYAHQLAVGDLLWRYYLPQLRAERDTPAGRRVLSLHQLIAANGADTLARDLLQLTERCTGRTGLAPTTLVCWEAVMSRLNLLRARRSWCAACYTGQAAEGRMPWDALCWMMRPVQVCPRHRQPLTEQCPQCRRSSVPVLHRYLPGWCPHCGAWLGNASAARAATAVKNEEMEVWVAEQIGTLLAATPSLPASPTRQQLATSIQSCCSEWLEGNTHWLARLLGVAAATALGWYAGQTLPPLRLLAQLSYWTKIPLLTFVTEPAAMSSGLRQAPPPPDFAARKDVVSHLPRRRPVGDENVKNQMEAALQETPPPSLANVAARLGYRCTETLRYKFPALSKQLTARYRTVAPDRSGKHAASVAADAPLTDEQMRKLLEQELAAPTPRAPVSLGRQGGYPSGYPWRRKFPTLYQALMQQRRQQRAEILAARLTQCRQALDAALAEMPPPTLHIVARRVGGMEVGFLRRHCAEQCDQLAARAQAARAERIKSAGDKLQQALEHDPPRSLNQLAKEVGYHVSTLVSHYPELCRALLERYARGARQKMADTAQTKSLPTVDRE